MSVFVICCAAAMTSYSELDFGSLLLLVLRPPCPWVYIGVCILEQLLVCRIRRLLLLAEGVVQFEKDATTEPQLHCYKRGNMATRLSL
jgi:hypothetical protein